MADQGRAIRRHELSDAEWEFVRPLLPESLRGGKRLDDRALAQRDRVTVPYGTAWRDVPERYGPWATLHTRFRRWALDGTFERMLQVAQARADAADGIDWLVSIPTVGWCSTTRNTVRSGNGTDPNIDSSSASVK
ncbi:transposase [Streptomyces sp. NPDC005402]|uniref:transposase n=1 Tax=Streptomyces sp. NPDC005402 TaxID=3155338 RepID=UPI0033B56868